MRSSNLIITRKNYQSNYIGTGANFCKTWDIAVAQWESGDYNNALSTIAGIYLGAQKAKEARLPQGFREFYFAIPGLYSPGTGYDYSNATDFFSLALDHLPQNIYLLAGAADETKRNGLIEKVTVFLAYYFALMRSESGFNPNADNGLAQGLGQIRLETAKTMAKEIAYPLPFDLLIPEDNIALSLYYFYKLAKDFDAFDTRNIQAYRKAVIAYKHGPADLDKALNETWAVKSWQEVKDYEVGILKYHQAEIAWRINLAFTPTDPTTTDQSLRNRLF